MDGEWCQCRLGDVIELKRGYDLPSTQRHEGRVPIVSSSGISGRHNVPMVKGPGVVTGRYGTIGEVHYVDEDFWPLNTTLYVRDFKGAVPRFVAYFLLTMDFFAYSDKAAVPGVNRNHLHEAKVWWPPKSAQVAIADLLGTLDDKIDLNRRLAATLEQIAQSLFKSWFVDFDPVRAKAEGRPTGLPDDIAALFPDRFNGEGLPEGWRRAPADDLVEVNPNVRLSNGTPAPYVGMAALPTSGPRVQGVIDRPAGSGARFQNADTLLARITPCLENGKTAFVDFLHGDQAGWGSTEFIVLRARPVVPAEWPYLLASDEAFRAHVIASMSGTSGRQRAPPSAVSRWEVARPGNSIFDAFGRASKALFARLTTLGEQSATLAALRDTLLPKLISGELRVADAEKRISAA